MAFFNGPNKKIDDVLLKNVGLPHVLPLTVPLAFDPFPTLSGNLNHVLPPRPSKCYRVDGTAGYPHVLSIAVHLIFEHLPNTKGYLGLLSEPCTPTQTL